MAQDKRGQIPEPTVEDGFEDIAAPDSEDFIAGPTSRNDVGNIKRAAAKATGVMGASKKIDPELDIDRIDDGRVKSGSSAGIRSFQEVPPEDGADDVHLTMSNEEIAESVTTTATKSPARREAQTDAATGSDAKPAMNGGAMSRKRVPAPGNVVEVPKGTLVRGHPTASQEGGSSQSSTGDGKPPKRSARAGGSQQERPVSKGGNEER